MMSRQLPNDRNSQTQIIELLNRILSQIPASSAEPSEVPELMANRIMSKASRSAAVLSGGLALPPGPLNLALILPDIVAIWGIQAQMVSDIAAVFGQTAQLTPEHMLYCMFRHSACHAVSNLVIQRGEQYVMRRAGRRTLQHVLRRIGIRIAQQAAAKAMIRWLPIAGALGCGGYAYLDTHKVGRTAASLFGGISSLEPQAVAA